MYECTGCIWGYYTRSKLEQWIVGKYNSWWAELFAGKMYQANWRVGIHWIDILRYKSNITAVIAGDWPRARSRVLGGILVVIVAREKDVFFVSSSFRFLHWCLRGGTESFSGAFLNSLWVVSFHLSFLLSFRFLFSSSLCRQNSSSDDKNFRQQSQPYACNFSKCFLSSISILLHL